MWKESLWFVTVPSVSQGIVKALQGFQAKLLEHKVQIYVRRGGPNYQEGLRIMREVGMFPLIYLGRGVLIDRSGGRGDHKVQIFVRRGG